MPLRSQIHRDRALENVSVAYKSDRLIAPLIGGEVPVTQESNLYYVYSRDTMSVPETLYQKGKVNRASWSMSTSTYTLEKHGLMDFVYDDDKKNADAAIKLDIDTTEILTGKILLRREKSLASMCQDKNNWANSTSLTSTLAWSQNTTTSNPITMIDSATTEIAKNSGYLPNVMVIDDSTFRAAKEHTSIVTRVQYTSADSISETMLAKLFSIPRLLVAGGIENTGEEGLSDTMSWIWTNAAWLGYVEQSPSIKKASAFYAFRKTDEGSQYIVERWRDDEEQAEAIRVKTQYQYKPVATACGYLIGDTY